MSDTDLAFRLQRLEDIDAIRQLKARYCLYADQDSAEAATRFAELFVENAVLDEGEELGILRGRDEIGRIHGLGWQHMRLNQHLVFNPTIDINGDQASGHWQLLQLTTSIFPDGDRAMISCGYYDETYRRTAKGWKFEHITARVHFCSPYEDGWARTPFGEFLPADVLAKIVPQSN